MQLSPGLGQGPALALVALSFFTSMITATFSLGGGALLISVMALRLPGLPEPWAVACWASQGAWNTSAWSILI